MSKPLLFLLPLVAVLSHANDIEQVAIYQGNALVSRSADVPKGEQVLVFDCLSASLYEDSLQVLADNAHIGDIQVKTLSDDEAKACQINDSTQKQQDDINANIQAYETSLSFLQNLGRAGAVPMSADLAKTTAQISEQTLNIAQKLNALHRQKEQLQRTLPKGQKTNKQVRIRLNAKQAGQVILRYLVGGASWQPSYQARLDTTSGSLSIDLQAVIRQNTGENWDKVKITLSGGQFGYLTSSNPPHRHDLRLRTADEEAYGVPLAAAAPMMLKSMRADAMAIEESDDFAITQQQTGDVVHYTPKSRLSLNNNDSTTLFLDNKSLKANVITRVNLDDNSAYWYAIAKPYDMTHWLPASVRLYRDGVFVGTGTLDGETLDKTGLGFGINRQVLVKTQDSDTARADVGIFGNKQSQRYDKTSQVINRLSVPSQLEILGGAILAKDSQISVKSTYQPKPHQTTWQGKDGILVWQHTLAPKQSLTIKQNHTISYPKDETLVGLPED